MTESQKQELLNRYHARMIEVRERDAVVYAITRKLRSAGSLISDSELIALNLRKMIELVTYANLISHKDEYASRFEKHASHWKYDQILDNIAKINPEFFPVPYVRTEDRGAAVKLLELQTKPTATLDDFKVIYHRCSQVLHVHRPFSNESPVDLSAFINDVPNWLQLIANLLNVHGIYLSEPGRYLICEMASGPQQAVNVVMTSAVRD